LADLSIFLLYLFGSIVMFITIAGIPFGIQTLKLAVLSLAPFGKDTRQGQRAGGCLYIIMNVIWIIFAGIEIAIVHAVLAILFAITIVGISICHPAYQTCSISSDSLWKRHY
jgi:uncharacterized membrane protein YccF (DUF307 family)